MKCYLFNIIRQKLNKEEESELCWGEDAVERKQAGRGKENGSLTFTDRIYIGFKIKGILLPPEKAKKNPNHSAAFILCIFEVLTWPASEFYRCSRFTWMTFIFGNYQSYLP